MSEEFYIYECHNCSHVFSSKVLVNGVGQCMKCRHDSVYLKPQSTGVQIEKVEQKDVVEVLSRFSTKELIEALKQKEDVQIADTSEDTWRVQYDLTKVKKYCLLINNCDVELVQGIWRLQEAERQIYAGGCCD